MADFSKRLGYGGSATIAGTQVLITSGNFDNTVTPSYIEAVSIQPFNAQRGRMLHADGVESFTGSLGFDVTEAALGVINTGALLSRGYPFEVGIHDGVDSYSMLGSLVTSLSLTGSAGGLITSTVSFMSKEMWRAAGVSNARQFEDDEVNKQFMPLAYWQSGNVGVKDWSFTMNQDVTPMYGNQNSTMPIYLKVGLVSYSLSVTTYEQVREHYQINIYSSSFTLTGTTTSRGYSYGGQVALGSYVHNFETSASASYGADGVVIS